MYPAGLRLPGPTPGAGPGAGAGISRRASGDQARSGSVQNGDVEVSCGIQNVEWRSGGTHVMDNLRWNGPLERKIVENCGCKLTLKGVN